jgi:hypothetical protein
MEEHWRFMLRSLSFIHFAQPGLLLSLWTSSPACGFQDFPVLADPASEHTAGLCAPSDFRQQ